MMKRSYWYLKACELVAIYAVFQIADPGATWRFVLLIPAVVAVNVCGWIEGARGPWGRTQNEEWECK